MSQGTQPEAPNSIRRRLCRRCAPVDRVVPRQGVLGFHPFPVDLHGQALFQCGDVVLNRRFLFVFEQHLPDRVGDQVVGLAADQLLVGIVKRAHFGFGHGRFSGHLIEQALNRFGVR